MSAPPDSTITDTSRKSRVEREAKLQASADFRLPEGVALAEDIRTGTAQAHRLDTVYYDTADLRLAQHDANLRFRQSEGWTLKLPLDARGQTLVRTEHTFQGPSDLLPSEALDLVQALIRREPLVPIARLRTVRRVLTLSDPTGRTVGEMVDDTVSVMESGRKTGSFREIEVELADDAADEVLDTVVSALLELGANPGPVQSKLVRALGARVGEMSAAPLELGGKSSVAEYVRSAIATSVKRLVGHDPGIRLASDSEQVHQARVATRRLRSDLRAFRAFLDPEWVVTLRAELKWLDGALGAVRDAEVLLERLTSQARMLPGEDRLAAAQLLGRLREELAEKRAELLIILRSDRYLDVLDRLDGAAREPAFVRKARGLKPSKMVRLARRPWRRLRTGVRSLPATPQDGDLHAVRIQAKRCRYTAEAVAPVVGQAAERFAASCRELQDVLGEHQDAVVAGGWLRHAASGASWNEAYAAGELASLEQRRAEMTRASWASVWKGLNRKRLRRWMKS